jgi:iron(III) transport system permease protein
LTAFRRVFLPIVAPAIFYSAMMVGMLSARDLTLPLMMNVGSSPLVSTLIFDLQTGGDFNIAAAIGLYMIVVLVLLLGVARWSTGLGEHGFSEAARRRRARLRLRLRAPRRATA